MKLKLIIIVAILLLFANPLFSNDVKMELKEKKDKISYSIGTNIGNTLKNQSIDINIEALIQGIKDSLSDSKPLMTDQEIQETLSSFQKERMEKQAEQRREFAEKNQKKGEAFLEENKKKEGVTTLESGLQYKVITEGAGEKPTYDDTVTIHYRGTLIDGTEFDSSYKRELPATFRVNGVIPGLTEALQLMKVGSKWQIFIPYHLAYGERGVGRTIGPNEALIFELELISLEKGMKFHTDQMGPHMNPNMNPDK